MPNLLSLITTGDGTLISHEHTPLIATLTASTRALASHSAGERTDTASENQLGGARGALAARMQAAALLGAELGGRPLGHKTARKLIAAASSLLAQADALAR